MNGHRSYALLAQLKQSSGLNGIRAHDLCKTGTVLYRLSYQATAWELVMGVPNVKYMIV